MLWSQGCKDQVDAEEDAVEVSKRQTQQKEVQNALHGPESEGPVAAEWFNCVFDETGTFVLFPSWRGIAVGAVATGKVCMPELGS